ncbi:MAG: histidine kinase [Bacteroidales bacterium]|jgi:sensor histidine kinase YesM|nr:histidine kinase [Bacteroidales bacterium]
MRQIRLTYRTAFLFSLAISMLMNILFLIMFFYGRDAVIPGKEIPPRPMLTLSGTLVSILFNFLTAFTLYIINFRLLRTHLPNAIKHTTIVLATICTVIITSYIFSTIHMSMIDHITPDDRGFSSRFIRGGMMRDSFIAIIVVFSSQLVYLSKRQQQTALEYKTLLSENMRTRYEVLKNQMDPHFLFNSLNTLNSLIKIDPVKAQEYVQQLSSVFRYTLQNKEVISLEEELNFTMSYCHLMQIRYGDSLQVIYNIDEKLYRYHIIPLSLQTLVENAIKHNVVSNRQPLVITFATDKPGIISVSNPIQQKKELEEGEGIGLTNLSERYRLMWQRDITIKREDGIFRVELPLMEPQVMQALKS